MIWSKQCTQWLGGTWTTMPMSSILSGLKLYCQLSKVRWTCRGADMPWQSRIESFAVSYTNCQRCIYLQLINLPIACLPPSINIVLVTNTSEFQDANGFIFTLNNKLMAKLIAKKHKGDLITLSNTGSTAAPGQNALSSYHTFCVAS
jgi:hypothetical protein